MKVTSIDIHASNSDIVMTLSFRDPNNKHPYIAKNILGLDASEITSKFYGSSITDKYYDLSMKKRDIVVQMELNPNFSFEKTYSMLRDELFKLISSSRTGAIQLRFKNGVDVVAAISGFVTKLESPQFTKSPEVQLTVSCDDPMLRSLTQTEVVVDDLDPTTTIIKDNESTAPHGLQLGVIFNDTSRFFFINDDAISPTWTFFVDLLGSPLGTFVADDKVQLCSEYNNKYLKLIRGINTYHLVDRITSESVWPIIFPGDNPFISSDLLAWDYIKHYPTYWGV